MWVKGSGSDLATMTREQFTVLRLDEMLPLIERDEMSDEDMVAHLARCMVDPALPRPSIETLLHAFIPAAARPPHPPRRDQRARRLRRRRGAGARVLRRRGRVDPVHPPRLHARQAGRRGGARQPGPAARGARQARAGVWGDSAEEAYRRRSRSSTAPRRSSTSAAAGTARFGGAADAGLDDRGAPRRAAARCCRCCAARCRSERRRSSPSTRRRGCSSSSARATPRAGHGRRRLPRPPRPHQAGPAVDRV